MVTEISAKSVDEAISRIDKLAARESELASEYFDFMKMLSEAGIEGTASRVKLLYDRLLERTAALQKMKDRFLQWKTQQGTSGG